jgi:hypothetical protein
MEDAVEGAALDGGFEALSLAVAMTTFDLQSGIRPARLNCLAGVWLAILMSFIPRLKKKRTVSVKWSVIGVNCWLKERLTP